MPFFGDVDVLQQPDGIPHYGGVYILPVQVVEKLTEIRCDQFGMIPHTIAERPGSPLRDPVVAIKEKFEQPGKAFFVLADIGYDPVFVLFEKFIL